ncbi:hypothetical protein [Microbacterium schleiferi]|uniref:hypothetical protein n=1 Tax=Microbacterium schleiferi TaxID=69362 RepID=UPI003AB9597D
MKKLVIAAAALVAMLPMSLLGVGLLMSPAAFAACLSSTSLVVGPIPESLTATTRSGATVTLDRQQLTRAATIITVGRRPTAWGVQASSSR